MFRPEFCSGLVCSLSWELRARAFLSLRQLIKYAILAGGAGTRGDDLRALGQGTLIGRFPGFGYPLIQDEWYRPRGREPFSVVSSCQVKMGAGGSPALTRGMAQ